MTGSSRATLLIFHGELAELVRRGPQIEIDPLDPGRSVKDAIESTGVPHTEIGRIEIDGSPVGFGARLRAGRRVDVHPNPVPPAAPSSLRPPMSRPVRFLLDGHLGRLAGRLRMLGFDTAWLNHAPDERLAELAAAESRVLLTRDRGLLKRSIVVHGRLIRADEPDAQLREVVDLLGLRDEARPFTRCTRCNAPIAPIEKGTVLDRLEPRTKAYFERFGCCEGCARIYWKGSHYERMHEKVIGLLGGSAVPPGEHDPSRRKRQ